MYTQRLENVRTRLREEQIDALLVGPSADLRYLTGYDALPLERLTLLVVPAEGPAHLVLPELELARAQDSGATDLAQPRAWGETEDPIDIVRSLVADAHALAVQDQLWTSFTLRLQAAIPAARWVESAHIMRPLRIIKSEEKQTLLREVAAAIDHVHAQVPLLLRAGRRESEVGREIETLIREEHDEVSFVIVGSGPNGASPHHETGERILEDGDAVVVDIGGVRDGYCSDCTRNYVVGRVPDGYNEMHAVLEQAQQAAVEAVKPGVPAESIDTVARDLITEAGFGEYFIHRTGHGIGIEGHEDPYIVAGNRELLQPGMAFSVEPGIYLPGRFGARIEDIVIVTDDGVEALNHRPRTVVVGG